MAVNPPLGDTMKRVTTVVLITLVLWACSGPGTDVVAVDADAGAEVVDSKVMEVIIKADTIETVDTGLDLGLDWGIEIPVLACDPGEGCFGDQCTENGDCDSGWCVEHMGESVCSQTCQEECPEGWTCTQVAGTVPDVVFVCVSDFPNLCRPCSTALDCAGATGTEDACLAYGEGGVSVVVHAMTRLNAHGGFPARRPPPLTECNSSSASTIPASAPVPTHQWPWGCGLRADTRTNSECVKANGSAGKKGSPIAMRQCPRRNSATVLTMTAMETWTNRTSLTATL